MIEAFIFSAAVAVVPARPVSIPVRPAPVRPAAPAKPTHVDSPHPANPVYAPVFIQPHRSCDTKEKDCKKDKP
jgi:hypothetical protein